MKYYFTKLVNFKILNKNKIEKQSFIVNSLLQCKKCIYYSKHSGICIIFNKQSVEVRKSDFLCGNEGEFYIEKNNKKV